MLDSLPVIDSGKTNDARRDYQLELVRLQTRHDDMAAEHNEVMRGRLRMQVGLYLREIAKGFRSRMSPRSSCPIAPMTSVR